MCWIWLSLAERKKKPTTSSKCSKEGSGRKKSFSHISIVSISKYIYHCCMTNTLHQQVHQFIINIDETHSTIALIKQKINWTYCECKPMQKREKKKGKWRKSRKIFYRRSVSVWNSLFCVSPRQYVVLLLSMMWIISNWSMVNTVLKIFLFHPCPGIVLLDNGQVT